MNEGELWKLTLEVVVVVVVCGGVLNKYALDYRKNAQIDDMEFYVLTLLPNYDYSLNWIIYSSLAICEYVAYVLISLIVWKIYAIKEGIRQMHVRMI